MPGTQIQYLSGVKTRIIKLIFDVKQRGAAPPNSTKFILDDERPYLRGTGMPDANEEERV